MVPRYRVATGPRDTATAAISSSDQLTRPVENLPRLLLFFFGRSHICDMRCLLFTLGSLWWAVGPTTFPPPLNRQHQATRM